MHPSSNQLFVSASRDKKLDLAFWGKGLPVARLKGVTVKMETPVIYFYGDDAPKVNVKVGFNGGTISQWYPQRKAGDTPNIVKREGYLLSKNLKKALSNRSGLDLVKQEVIDFSKPYEGGIEWDVEVLPKSMADPAFSFKSNENHAWFYPRVSSANMVKVGKEYEDYLFYRGVGNFKLPVVFSVDADETLKVENKGTEAVPFALAFENMGAGYPSGSYGRFRYRELGSLAAGDSVKVAEGDWVEPSEDNQQVEVFQKIRNALVAQGLSFEEANGMVKTWWKSYFEKPGLRVFWIVPQGKLEKILPMTLNPEPEKKVRVMVGRAEVLRPKLEKMMVDRIGSRYFKLFENDRFYQPYKHRLEQLIPEPVYKRFNAYHMEKLRLILTAKKRTPESEKDGDMSIWFDLRKHYPVEEKKMGLIGKWEVVGSDTLLIGDVKFKLDAKKGLLTAKAAADSGYEFYEIQLPKVLH